MKEIPLEKAEAYVEQHITGHPPLFWLLQAPEMPPIDLFAGGFVFVRRYSQSGSFEIRFQERAALNDDFIAAILSQEKRRPSRNVESDLSGVRLLIETNVVRDLDSNEYLPVLGPGGRIIVFRERHGSAAEVTVRQRVGAIKANWRNPAEIVSRLSVYQSDLEISSVRAAFGYLELSKYETQHLMRPVFLFSVEQSQNEEPRLPGWRMTVVEPATFSSDFTLDEGTGNWLEQPNELL